MTSPAELSGLTKARLLELAKEAGINGVTAHNTKSEIIERLSQA